MKIFRMARSSFRIANLRMKTLIRNLFGAGITLNIGKRIEFGKGIRFGLRSGSSLSIGNNCAIGSNCEIIIERKGRIEIGDFTVLFENGTIECSKDAKLTLGKSIIMNKFCMAHAEKNITIGDFSLIAEMVSIRDNDKDYRSEKLLHDSPLKSDPVSIGKDTWLCSKVTVTKGVSIGDRSIVGANSVVTKSVPKGEIWAGVPAKFVKKR